MTYEDLQSHRIHNLPGSFYYIPNFLTASEETALLAKINASSSRWTQLSHRRLQVYPTALTTSNVLLGAPLPSWLSQPLPARFHDLEIFTANEAEHNNTSPTSGNILAATHGGTRHKTPNHVLINEYQPGQGIMPHEDGSAYAPVVATVTLGGHCVLDLYSKLFTTNPHSPCSTDVDADTTSQDEGSQGPQPHHRILQEPLSLLVTRGNAYKSFLHGIADVTCDTGLSRDTIANWDSLGDAAQYEAGWKERDLRVSLTFRDVIKVSSVGSRLLGRGK